MPILINIFIPDLVLDSIHDHIFEKIQTLISVKMLPQ